MLAIVKLSDSAFEIEHPVHIQREHGEQAQQAAARTAAVLGGEYAAAGLNTPTNSVSTSVLHRGNAGTHRSLLYSLGDKVTRGKVRQGNYVGRLHNNGMAGSKHRSSMRITAESRAACKLLQGANNKL